MGLKHIILDFFNLIYPAYCYACVEDLEKNENVICTNCRMTLPRLKIEQDENNEMAKRFWGKVKVENAFAYYKFEKKGKVQKLLHHLKYEGKTEIGEMAGHWLANEIKDDGIEIGAEIIIPIPLHKSKLRSRGYNQSDSFAKGLSEKMNIPWSDKILKKHIATSTQTKKNRYERFKNVEDVFTITNNELIQDKHILLVDDVITTGSTFESAIKTLLENGASKVSIAAIASANK